MLLIAIVAVVAAVVATVAVAAAAAAVTDERFALTQGSILNSG